MDASYQETYRIAISNLLAPPHNNTDIVGGMTFANNLKPLREAQGLSQPQLAKLAGVSQSLIAQLQSGAVTSTKHIFKIAKIVKAPVSAFDESAADQDIGTKLQKAPIVSNRADTPIYTSAEGGRGALIVTWEPVEWIVRPAPLLHAKGGYGVLVSGDSMFPAYEPGDTALVNPLIKPALMRDAIFFKGDDDNISEALIKRLIRASSTEWHVRQWNPARDFTLKRAEWGRCHAVIGKWGR